MKVKDVIFSWDLLLSLVLAFGMYIILPELISDKFAIQFYNIGVSVLSIVFSVFFASLAVIIASPSDDFVKFFNERGSYDTLLDMYKYSLLVLFIGLFHSIVGYVVSSYFVEEFSIKYYQHKFFISLFVFSFSYSLFCCFNSAKDAVLYSLYRSRFLNKK